MPKWIRSSACNADSPMCVEAHQLESGEVVVRNSTAPAVTIPFSLNEWRTFVEGCRRGDFDF